MTGQIKVNRTSEIQRASNKIEIVKEDRQLKITKNESADKKKLQSEDDFFFPYKSKQHRH